MIIWLYKGHCNVPFLRHIDLSENAYSNDIAYLELRVTGEGIADGFGIVLATLRHCLEKRSFECRL